MTWNKVKHSELEIGDRVKVEGEGFMTVISVKAKEAALEKSDGDDWKINLRSDGFWGGDEEEGFLLKDNNAPIKAIVCYSLIDSADPTEEFETVSAAKTRIEQLYANPDVEHRSIALYEVSKKYKVHMTCFLEQVKDKAIRKKRTVRTAKKTVKRTIGKAKISAEDSAEN